jgi:hypothetical protein
MTQPQPPKSRAFCDWSNCDSEEIIIAINYRNGLLRPTFCCTEHAAKWLRLMGKYRTKDESK